MVSNFLSWVDKYDQSFLPWAKENGIDLGSVKENAYRTGVRPQYPDGYIRSQYPDAYFPPYSATAVLDLANSKKVKSKAPSDNAP